MNGAPHTSVCKRLLPLDAGGSRAHRKPTINGGFYTATDTKPPKTRAVAAKPSACKADER